MTEQERRDKWEKMMEFAVDEAIRATHLLACGRAMPAVKACEIAREAVKHAHEGRQEARTAPSVDLSTHPAHWGDRS